MINSEKNRKRVFSLPMLRQLFEYLFCLSISLLGIFIVLEIIVRVLFYGPGPVYTFDPNLGYVYGYGTKIFNGIEGFGTVHFVADGEIATPYSGGKNVVVLGDSHTIAIQVDDNNNFVSVAEEILNKDGYDIDLRNYGVMGNRMPDYIYLANHVKTSYRPDVMVIQLAVDDFGESAFDVNQPSYFIISNGSLILKHNDPIKKHSSFLEVLNRNSALSNFAYFRLFQLSEQLSRRKEVGGNKQVASSAEVAYKPEEVIKMQLQALVNAYSGIPIIIVMLPFTPRIQDSNIIFQESDYKTVTDIIGSVDGLYLLDPLPGFNNLVLEGKLPRGFLNTEPGKAHLNINGHQVVGNLLAQMLEEISR